MAKGAAVHNTSGPNLSRRGHSSSTRNLFPRARRRLIRVASCKAFDACTAELTACEAREVASGDTYPLRLTTSPKPSAVPLGRRTRSRVEGTAMTAVSTLTGERTHEAPLTADICSSVLDETSSRKRRNLVHPRVLMRLEVESGSG